jgi:hypothetical protein
MNQMMMNNYLRDKYCIALIHQANKNLEDTLNNCLMRYIQNLQDKMELCKTKDCLHH